MCMRKYVEKFVNQYPELLDLVANDVTTMDASISSNINKVTNDLYPPHLGMTEILQGLKSRKYLKGIIRCQYRDNPFDCYVIIRTSSSSVDGQSIQRSVLIKG